MSLSNSPGAHSTSPELAPAGWWINSPFGWVCKSKKKKKICSSFLLLTWGSYLFQTRRWDVISWGLGTDLVPAYSCHTLPHAPGSCSCLSRLVQWHFVVSRPGLLPSGQGIWHCGQSLRSEDGDRIRYHRVLSAGASLNVSCHLIADRHSSPATQASRRQEASWGQGVCFIYWFGKIFSLPGTEMCIPGAWSHEIWQVPYQMPKAVIQLSLI